MPQNTLPVPVIAERLGEPNRPATAEDWPPREAPHSRDPEAEPPRHAFPFGERLQGRPRLPGGAA